MKFYNSDKLFIGNIGHISLVKDEDKQYKRLSTEIISIVKQKSTSVTYRYYDILSNNMYIDFDSEFCEVGNVGIANIMPLPIFLYKLYKNNQDNEVIDRLAKKIIKRKKLSYIDIKNLILYLNNNDKFDNFDTNLITSNTKVESNGMNYISTLTAKDFNNRPAIGREREIKDIIVTLAQERKNPILVGPSGCGKTAIVDELAYMIQKGEVPNFLKNKQIIELDMTSLVAGTRYLGTLEEKVNRLINLAIKRDAIIFIDEIHTIYGTGTSDKNDNDFAGMVKQAIDRKGLRVIGTTTEEEYEEYFSNDALKRRFEKIEVYEPTKAILFEIVNSTFINYSNKYNISLPNNIEDIINILIELTDGRHRTWNDKVCNPDLVIGIIDRIFADAKVNDQNKITLDNIIYGIRSCNRVYDSIKEDIINRIYFELDRNINQKVIKLSFNEQSL